MTRVLARGWHPGHGQGEEETVLQGCLGQSDRAPESTARGCWVRREVCRCVLGPWGQRPCSREVGGQGESRGEGDWSEPVELRCLRGATVPYQRVGHMWPHGAGTLEPRWEPSPPG